MKSDGYPILTYKRYKPGSSSSGCNLKYNYFIHWMEESMYLKIEHPPPNTFIKGGTGRIIGKGLIDFDGRSGSYSLKNGPGDPSGLFVLVSVTVPLICRTYSSQ
jgi:hypothetical protein